MTTLENEINQLIDRLTFLLKKQECKKHLEEALNILEKYPEILDDELNLKDKLNKIRP
jgi:hypothetical protein